MTVTIQSESPATRASQSWSRISGFAGVAYAVIFFALGAGIASGAPGFTDGADEIRTWFGDNQGSIALFTWLAPLTAGPLFLLFASGLRSKLETVDPTGGVLTRVFYSGAIANFAFSLVGLGLWGVMSLDPVLESASDGLLVTLSALDAVVFFAIAPWAMGLFAVGASVIMLTSRVMPAWVGGLGCVTGTLSVLGGTWILSGDPDSAIAAVGFIASLAILVWVLITSVFMLRGKDA